MEEDVSFTSFHTTSLEESDDYDEEEQDLQQHLVRLKNGTLEQQIESMKYLRSQIKKISPMKVFRLFHFKYLDILNDIIKTPLNKLGKEAIYNLCGILKLERKHYQYQQKNLIIDKIISLNLCDRLATIMGDEMQNDKFGKLVNKLLWINIEIVNYSQQNNKKNKQRVSPPNEQPQNNNNQIQNQINQQQTQSIQNENTN
ncbi:hypothetical protein ABPG72_005185 [Tetrahymena utriculariae]